MKRIKRMIAIFLYLFIVSVALKLELGELLNLRQFLLVVVGGIVLYLPGVEKKAWSEKRKPDYALIARNTLYASYIATFVLLFFLLYRGEGSGAEAIYKNEIWNTGIMMKNIALSLRPLLYGMCIWIAFGGEENAQHHRNEQVSTPPKVWTAQESYQRFLELGLTRREAEVAVQVGKGLSNKEIAMELNITEATVKKHMANIFEKLGVERRDEIRERLMQ